MITGVSHEAVFHVAANMRAADKEEIYPLHWDESPFVLTAAVMAAPRYAYLAWDGNRPIAVFGAAEIRPTVWQAYCFATDEFPKVYREVTKFLLRNVKPYLFKELGANRIFADSHIAHKDAHRWLQRLGAKQEGFLRAFNKKGETYVSFAMTRQDFVG
jgi:RimJ/RimL family protein N-acetyltransferase